MSNTVFLLAAYLVVDHGYTAEEAWAPFKRISGLPILAFCHATYCPQDYDLEILHCLMGLRKAIDVGWFDPKTFDQNEYELLDDPENADMHFLSPDFAAFKGPSARRTKLAPGVYTMTPKHYSSIFQRGGVKNVVRLNEPASYDKAEFEKYGIRHHDLYFDDCTVPSNAVVTKFLKIAESAIIGREEKVAVHCKAGLGRTGTLIAIYWMKHFDFTAHECLGWLRIVRPGSVIGPQQQYLHWAEEHVRKFKQTERSNLPPVVCEPALAVSADRSAQMGLEVAAAQNARSSRRMGEGHGNR